jgi:diguanylate cyclase (GGDEF)-like protein
VARILSWYSAVVVLLAGLYAAVPMSRSWVIGAAGLLSVATIEVGLRWRQPEREGAWRCLQGSLALIAVGDILFQYIQADPSTAEPYPGAPDIVTVAGYLLLSVGLFWLGRPQAPQRDETSLIDAISLTLAGSLIVWITLVRPVVESQALNVAGRVTALLALLGYLSVLAASVRLALGWRRNAAVVTMVLALILFLLSELFHGHQFVQGTLPLDGRIDLGYIALAAGSGAAALTRSMRDIASPESGRHSLTPWRLALIAAALLVAPAVLFVEAGRGLVETGMSIASAGALVSFLVLVRLSMSGRAYRDSAAREHAVRVASQAMVSAVTASDVIAGTRQALRSLLPEHGIIDADLIDRRATNRPPRVVVPVGPGERGELLLPLSGSDLALIFAAPTRILAVLRDVLDSLADQAAVALQRIGLAEVAGAEERERYFRTLVMTSTDVILISRDGRIEYATPSAEAMFGRNVVGERFNDIVRRPGQRDADPQWPDNVDNIEGVISDHDGDIAVVIRRRDLTGDPTVRGIVTTLRDVTAERELQRDLTYRASHDELTGMVNAREWGETLSAEAERRRGPGNGTAVIFIDLDEFKSINDRYGHPTGDKVLADMAQRMRECVRAGDVAARVGGDEFAILLRGLPSVDDARVVAQRLAEALSRPVTVDSIPIECKASIGLAYTEGQERIDALVRQADTALYSAKEQGKGRWTEYNPKQWAPARSVHDGNHH